MLEAGEPRFPGRVVRQFSETRSLAAQARDAAAWRACELSAAAKEDSCARRAQRACSSFWLTPRPSLHSRTALVRMNCVVGMASSTAAAWARERRSLYA